MISVPDFGLLVLAMFCAAAAYVICPRREQ